jgi:hypothetical protein
MKSKAPIQSSLPAALILALGLLIVPFAARAQTVSQTARTGAYSVNLKVLPAESFTGPHAAMARDGGAEANRLGGPEDPNHHMVAFIRKSGKPLEDATVFIRYRELSPKIVGWMTLPVVRMHVAEQGLQTTHFGNNVNLAPGSYEAQVTVNGSAPATFRFSLAG